MTQAPVLLPQFALAVRGYDRQQVDDYVARLVRDLDEAHARAVAAERTARSGGGVLRQPAEHGASSSGRPLTQQEAPLAAVDPGVVPVVDEPSVPAPLPLAGLAGSAAPPARRRAGALAAAGALALTAAVGVAAVAAPDADRAARPAASAPAAAPAPDLPAVAVALQAQGAQAGPAAGALRGALRRLQSLTGLERQSRALSLAGDVERAVAKGELTRETQQLVRPALLATTEVDDVRELVSVLAVRPAAAGDEGLALLAGLRELRDRPTAQRRAALVEQVRTGPERRALTQTVRDVALPVLERSGR